MTDDNRIVFPDGPKLRKRITHFQCMVCKAWVSILLEYEAQCPRCGAPDPEEHTLYYRFEEVPEYEVEPDDHS